MILSTKQFFDRYTRKEHRSALKHAKDPNHKHVREFIGSTVAEDGKKKRCYWCKLCHAPMPAKSIIV